MQQEKTQGRNENKPKINNKFPMLHKLSQKPNKKKQSTHDSNDVYMARGATENINPSRVLPIHQINQN